MDDITPSTLSWDPRLPLDIALNKSSASGRPLYNTEDLIARYGLSAGDLRAISELPAFRKDVQDAMHELTTNGLTVKRKATALFEYYIDDYVPKMMADAYVDPKVKLETVKFLGQVAGKDGKAEAEAAKTPMAPTLNVVLQVAPDRSGSLNTVVDLQSPVQTIDNGS